MRDEDFMAFSGLAEAPFTLTPDPAFLFPTRDNQTALHGICACVDRGEGYAVMTGDVGTGKTTVCRAVLSHVNSNAETALILNPFLSETELLAAILRDFGLAPDENAARANRTGTQRMMEQISDFLTEAHRKSRRCLAVIDESHNLPISTLEQLRILGNLETNKEKLLQIVLVGQPELLDSLTSPAVRQLHQRIANWYRLEPLAAEQVESYFHFRLERAGLKKELKLYPGAAELVYKLTRGYPRLMNMVFDRTLREVVRQRKWGVDEEDVRAATEHMPLEQGIPQPLRAPSRRRRRLSVAVISVVLLAAIAGGLLGFWRGVLSRAPSPVAAQSGRAEAARWTVSVGVFESKADAEGAVRSARSRLQSVTGNPPTGGYVVTLRDPTKGEQYLAVIGESQEEEGAVSLSEKLKVEGFDANVLDRRVLKLTSDRGNE